MNGQPWTSDDDATLKKMFDAGLPYSEIAERLGRTVGTLKWRRKLLGLKHSDPELARKAARKSVWTDDVCKHLVALFHDGLSAAQISQQLGRGISRNAVIGRLHRMGLSNGRSNRSKGGAGTHKRRPRAKVYVPNPRKRKRVEFKVPDRVEDAAPPPHERVRMEDATLRHCCFPIGEPNGLDTQYCGRKVDVTQTYCDVHHAICHDKPQKKSKRPTNFGFRAEPRA